MSRTDLNSRLRNLVVKVVEIQLFVMHSFGHNVKFVVQSCFWYG